MSFAATPGTRPDTANKGYSLSTVAIGNISFTDEESQYISDGDGDEVWGDYVIVNHYEKDNHRYMMSVTSPHGIPNQGDFVGDTVSFVQLGMPTLLWICDWTASRAGKQPDIPEPRVQDQNWILLDEYYEPEMVTVVGDGKTPVYRISGTYVYGHKRPSAQTFTNLNYGRPPWLHDVYDRTISQERLKPNLSEVGQGKGGGVTGNPGGPTYGITTGGPRQTQ